MSSDRAPVEPPLPQYNARNLTRDERVEYQEYDGGDPSEEVYILRASSSVCYHDDEDCQHIRQSPRDPDDKTRAVAQRRWLAPCFKCVLEGWSQ